MRVTISSPDLKLRVAEFKSMGQRAESRNLLDRPEVRRELEDASERRFTRGLKQDTAGWRAAKRRMGLIDRPMRATDAAFQALTSGTGPQAGSVIFEANQRGVTWGVKPGSLGLFYVHINALGRGGVKRQVVVVDKTAREGIAEQMLEFLLKPL